MALCSKIVNSLFPKAPLHRIVWFTFQINMGRPRLLVRNDERVQEGEMFKDKFVPYLLLIPAVRRSEGLHIGIHFFLWKKIK